MEYHGKIGHNIGRIHHIAIMSGIGICYTVCSNATFWLVTLIKPYFIILILMMAQMYSYLHVMGINLNTTKPRIV